MKWLFDLCAEHTLPIGWMAFVISLGPVILATWALCKLKSPETRGERFLRKTEFFLLWCCPFVALLSTKSSEWASEKQSEQVKEHRVYIGSLSNQLTQTTQELASAKAEVDHLKGRTISPKQRQVLVENVKKIATKYPNFNVVIWAQDAEARAYGNQFLNIFKECGVSGHFFANGGFQNALLAPGIKIQVSNTTNLQPIAVDAFNLLMEAEFQVQFHDWGERSKKFFSEDNVNLLIGEKP